MTKKMRASLINDVTIAVTNYLETQKKFLMRNDGDFNEVFCTAISYTTGFASELTIAEAFDIARSCTMNFLNMRGE